MESGWYRKGLRAPGTRTASTNLPSGSERPAKQMAKSKKRSRQNTLKEEQKTNVMAGIREKTEKNKIQSKEQRRSLHWTREKTTKLKKVEEGGGYASPPNGSIGVGGRGTRRGEF